MNKAFLIARKTTAIFLLFILVLTLNITAFADSPDTSPNVPRRTEETTQPATAMPSDVKPVKTYTVALGKTYKLPADVKQEALPRWLTEPPTLPEIQSRVNSLRQPTIAWVGGNLK